MTRIEKLVQIAIEPHWFAVPLAKRVAAGAGYCDAKLARRSDASEVAQAIRYMMADALRRAAMGVAGRELVQRKWTWDVVATQLTAEYERVIARHKNGVLT